MSKKERIYVDFHIIQTVPPSCVNRDDTGSPKTAIYGGVARARVSSQSWKYAIREMFRDIFENEDVGSRTKQVKSLVANQILTLDPSANAEKLAEAVVSAAPLKLDKKKGTTGALFFISDAQINALAEIALSGGEQDKAKIEQALKDNPSIDMALFGRMVAEEQSLNYDAAVQVAHAISTHAVHNEYDYFTAVDDCAADDNAGAAHLGTVEYNSATLYRYATVNINELRRTIGGKTPYALKGFAEAFISSMPTGKQNSFANRTIPDLVYITVRRNQPVNLVGAFEQPVNGKNGFVEASIESLANHALETYEDFACEPDAVFVCGKGAKLFGEKKTLPIILDELENTITDMLEE